ncbi:hypothetical protein EIN43_07480 [Enterobacter hormaechei]|uniref:Uncharacterized protein n=1 Tax=Enterobacter hormaechei TaxID=158836 RepID=A0A4Y5ZTT1_9ENTR|nr:hypothetical protein EIN43_07480 [Enterobacter hormaechei]
MNGLQTRANAIAVRRHYLEGNNLQLIIIIFSGPFRRSALLRAASAQILAIYENFLVYAISVLLLVFSLFC